MSTIENLNESPKAALLPDTLRLGPAQLDVSNRDTSVDYYERVVGLQVHRRDDGRAALGAGGEDLLVLHQQPGAAPSGRHAGLFHFALLFPTREALARAIRGSPTRAPGSRVPPTTASPRPSTSVTLTTTASSSPR